MSNAERQRKYRAKRDADPIKRKEYLQKEKEKYRKDLQRKVKKNVEDMTERERKGVLGRNGDRVRKNNERRTRRWH